jgi:hypothetical protein
LEERRKSEDDREEESLGERGLPASDELRK